jgi:hypothetical protein
MAAGPTQDPADGAGSLGIAVQAADDSRGSAGSTSVVGGATPIAGQTHLASQMVSAGRDARFTNIFVVAGGINMSGTLMTGAADPDHLSK